MTIPRSVSSFLMISAPARSAPAPIMASTIAASEPRAIRDKEKSVEAAMTPTGQFRSLDDARQFNRRGAQACDGRHENVVRRQVQRATKPRARRLELARAQQVPPYVIFHGRTLADRAARVRDPAPRSPHRRRRNQARALWSGVPRGHQRAAPGRLRKTKISLDQNISGVMTFCGRG